MGYLMSDVQFQMPRLRTMASHALPYLIEATFIARITLLWAFVNLGNAAMTITLLLTQSVGTYVLAKSVLSLGLTGCAIVVSTVWFRRSMRRNGILLRAA